MGVRQRLLRGADRDDVAHDAIVNMRQLLSVLPSDMVAELNQFGEFTPWLPSAEG